MDDIGPFADPFTPGMKRTDGIVPVFFTDKIENPARTAERGVPQFDEIEMVRKIIPGDTLNIVTALVDEEVKADFPEQYRRWKMKDESLHLDGTPLNQWPELSIARIAEFNAIGIHTIEALSKISDANVTKLGPEGRTLRAKAEAFLEHAKGIADVTKYAGENERLRGELDDLRTQFQDLSARLDAQESQKNREPRHAKFGARD